MAGTPGYHAVLFHSHLSFNLELPFTNGLISTLVGNTAAFIPLYSSHKKKKNNVNVGARLLLLLHLFLYT